METHWGLGRQDGCWTAGCWHFTTTADPAKRYAGICICGADSIAATSAQLMQSWVPGRMLHVRIKGALFSVDVIGVYQWVQRDKTGGDGHAEAIDKPRHKLWTQLGRLLSVLPARNILVLAGDMNAYCLRHGSNVGSGVLASQQKLDEEFQQLLRQHNLCALNTSGRARASHCATYINGSTRTQIDFVLTRLQHADPQARAAAPIELNLAPWRLGSRHRPVCASIPWSGGWERRNRRLHTAFGYSLPDLRAASSQPTLAALCSRPGCDFTAACRTHYWYAE